MMELTLVGCPPLSILARNAIQDLPNDIVESWTIKQKRLVIEGFFHLDMVTKGAKTPRLFQIQAMLAVLEKKDLVVRAGTGYGKTLCMVLPLLVNREAIAITVTPLKLLQRKHVRSDVILMYFANDLLGRRI
jgi:ATP-dependent helicase YprA (DUF1998 family)